MAEKQVALKAEFIKEQQYAAAWEADRLKKISREQTEVLVRQEMEARVLAGLDEQVADLKQRRAQESVLLQHEADLMVFILFLSIPQKTNIRTAGLKKISFR